jgi:hypothetical protein
VLNRLLLTILILCGTELSAPYACKSAEEIHQFQGDSQTGNLNLRVLLPDSLIPGKRYATIYILPVEAGAGTRWGNPVAEAKALDLANQLQVICVFPQFAQLPWYADHPTDPGIQQESYFLKTVIPFVESHHPVRAESGGRFLLGFSKSGFGAWSLLLRHPELFARAAAFDAPLMQNKPDKYGMGPIFGTDENFERYRIPVLLKQRAAMLQQSELPRLILIGAGNFQQEHEQMHALLKSLKIPHVDIAGPHREHAWGSGWMESAARLLMHPDSEPSQ